MRMRRAVSALLSVYVSVPVILYLFPWILGQLIYAHLVRFPFFVDLSQPEDLLNHTHNFYLDTEEGVSVGVWHTLPAGQWEEAAEKSAEWYQRTLGHGQPVIIYLHGNLGTRAINHRVQLVKILSAAGYHVFSLDYRGFGDSSGEPSEAGLTRDAVSLYHWVKSHSGVSLVCLWGHSLGTGSVHLLQAKLSSSRSAVDALILEAPYTRIGDVVVNHPLSKVRPTLSSPLLILHAEDDYMVPHHMGLKLYEIALQAQRERHTGVPVEMISYKAELGYSHNDVYLDPNLSDIVG
uniref:AB hydrolase-1 domain-containing protein n=1 Tax=Salarias fasciatus TaxID=181472 RepID=A0A672J6X7_SALFA